MPIEAKPNGKGYSDAPRKAAPSEELRGDDGANSMNTLIQRQRQQDRMNRAAGRVKRITPGSPCTRDAARKKKKKRLAEKRNDPVST